MMMLLAAPNSVRLPAIVPAPADTPTIGERPTNAIMLQPLTIVP